jgi:hypothetical protein
MHLKAGWEDEPRTFGFFFQLYSWSENMRVPPLPPAPALRKQDNDRADSGGGVPRAVPKRRKATNRLTEPTMEMLSAALQAHECLELNRCTKVGIGYTTADERARQEEARRKSAMFAFVSALAGVMIAVIENELRWGADSSGQSSQATSTALKGVVVGSTLVTFFFLYQYYDAAVSQRRLAGVRLDAGVSFNSLRGAGLLYQFLFEIAIMLPQPLPGVDMTLTVYNKGVGNNSVYDIDSLLCVAMFVRVFYLPRFYGEVLSDLRSDAALAISRVNSVVLDTNFVVKYVLANSLECVIMLTVLSIILFAYTMMVFERPVHNGTLGDYANCLWLIIITMTTVGYGDEFPITVLGRCVAVTASLAAVILLAITTNLVVSKLTLSRSEVKVIEVMSTISLRDDLRTAAAVVIQRWTRAYSRYMKVRRGGGGKEKSGSKTIKSAVRMNIDLRAAVLSDVDLLECITDFKSMSDDNFADRLQNDIPELLGNLNSKLHHQEQRISNLQNMCQSIDRLSTRLCQLKGNRSQ